MEKNSNFDDKILNDWNLFKQNDRSKRTFCRLHPDMQFEYLKIDQESDGIFKCIRCINEADEEISQRQLLPISYILQKDTSSSVFYNFPFNDRSLLISLKKEMNGPSSNNQFDEMDQFFKHLKASVEDKMEKLYESLMERKKRIVNFKVKLAQEYDKICLKNEMKSVIINSEINIEEIEQRLSRLIQQANNSQEENKRKIQNLLTQYQLLSKSLNFENASNLQLSIGRSLDKLNQLFSPDMRMLEEQNKQDQKNVIGDLMKLVNNKMNEVSSEDSKRFEYQLNKISFILQELDVPTVGPVYENLELLDSNNISVLKKLTKELADNLNKIQRESLRENQDLNELKRSDIMMLLKNKTNFCSEEHIEDVEKVIKVAEGIIEQFFVRKHQIKQKERNTLQGLSLEQLNDLVRLGAQINTLTKKNGNQYQMSNLPSEQIQKNSFDVRNAIINELKKWSLSSIEVTEFEKRINKILVRFPIFELIPRMKYENYLHKDFTQNTDFYESSEIIMKRNQQGQLQISMPNGSFMGEVVSFKLDNAKAYILKLQFNKSMKPEGYFIFAGLTRSKDMISKQSSVVINEKSVFSTDSRYGAKIKIRGLNQNWQQINQGNQLLEFRWCISRKLFFIADEPHQNITQSEESVINPLDEYHFGIFLQDIPDLVLTVTQFAEIDSSFVDKFD